MSIVFTNNCVIELTLDLGNIKISGFSESTKYIFYSLQSGPQQEISILRNFNPDNFSLTKTKSAKCWDYRILKLNLRDLAVVCNIYKLFLKPRAFIN